MHGDVRATRLRPSKPVPRSALRLSLDTLRPGPVSSSISNLAAPWASKCSLHATTTSVCPISALLSSRLRIAPSSTCTDQARKEPPTPQVHASAPGAATSATATPGDVNHRCELDVSSLQLRPELLVSFCYRRNACSMGLTFRPQRRATALSQWVQTLPAQLPPDPDRLVAGSAARTTGPEEPCMIGA